jgi:hypothetical protein
MDWTHGLALFIGNIGGALGMAYACRKWPRLAARIVRETERIVDQAGDLAKKGKG